MNIIIQLGPGQGRKIPLATPRVTVGRAGESDISLQGDWLVSRRHCEIIRRGSIWSLVDVGSKNGTILNGQPITTPSVLKPGDSIRLGSCELVVQ